jgi:predicted GTPase
MSLIQKNNKGMIVLVNKWDLIEKDNSKQLSLKMISGKRQHLSSIILFSLSLQSISKGSIKCWSWLNR